MESAVNYFARCWDWSIPGRSSIKHDRVTACDLAREKLMWDYKGPTWPSWLGPAQSTPVTSHSGMLQRCFTRPTPTQLGPDSTIRDSRKTIGARQERSSQLKLNDAEAAVKYETDSGPTGWEWLLYYLLMLRWETGIAPVFRRGECSFDTLKLVTQGTLNPLILKHYFPLPHAQPWYQLFREPIVHSGFWEPIW